MRNALPKFAAVGLFLLAGAALIYASVLRPADDLPAKLPVAEKNIDADTDEAKLVLAGGCFWCVEAVFEPLDGVTDVVSGYAGGTEADADYKKVSAGQTDHAEAVEITYNPKEISYGKLLQVFFATHNPLTPDGQHPDYGKQYRPAIFYNSMAQKQVAEAYIEQLNSAGIFDQPIATGLEKLTKFYPAEDYHQDYVEHHPDEAYVRQWSLPKIEKVKKLFPELLDGEMTNNDPAPVEKVEKTDAEWKAQLTEEQYYVLREEGTERSGTSPLNKVKEPGTFVCAACDLPLFETKTKFESGTGWPSFYEPIASNHVTEKADRSHGMVRTEVECARCGGHLGHVFSDGPEPTGLRYCMNGVAMKFEANDPSQADTAKSE